MPIDTDDGMNYLQGMAVAQRFASENREEMMRRLSMHLRAEPIDFIGNDNVIRKGVTSAKSGKKVIISFNMAKGI